MAIIYVDLENGDDSEPGTSFAERKKTLASAVESSTLSAGDTVRIMGSPNPTLVGNGDVVDRNSNYIWDRTISSSNISFSTTEGETVVTLNNHHLSTGDTVGFAGTLNETGINGHWEITKVDDNSFKLNGFTALTTSASGTAFMWDKTGSRIKLASAVTQNIASTGPRTTAWTASSNAQTLLVTSTSASSQRDGQYIEHSYSDQIEVQTNFGTGKAAYFPTGTLDLSGYQQISFMVSQPSGTKATPDPLLPTTAGNYSLRLCSDTQGNTTEHTINFNVYSGLAESFRPITVDLGTNLNSSIQSIALYIDTDLGAQTIRLNNIIACKASSAADSLTLSSLIGLNTAANPCWYAIESINGTRVLLHCTQPHSSYSYTPLQDDMVASSADWSSSGTKSIYKRETIKTLMRNSTSSGNSGRLTDHDVHGTSSNRITISGGWNQTDMSTQTGMTFMDGTNNRGVALYGDSDYTTYEKLGFTRYFYGYYGTEDYAIYDDIHHVFNYQAYLTDRYLTTLNNICNVQNHYVSLGNSSNYPDTFNKIWNVQCYAVNSFGNSNSTCEELNVIGCGPFDLNLPPGTTTTANIKYNIGRIEMNGYHKSTITNLNNKNNGKGSNSVNFDLKSSVSDTSIIENLNDITDQLRIGSTTDLRATTFIFQENFNIQINGGTFKSQPILSSNSTTKLNNINFDFSGLELGVTGHGLGDSATVQSRNHDTVSGVYKTFITSGENNITSTLTKESSIRNTASGISWKWERLQTDRHDANTPYVLNLGKVAVGASTQCTFKLHVRRSHTVGFAKLKVPKNTSIGISSDVTAVPSGSADTWEEISLNFTPNQQGFVDVQVEFYATSTQSNVIVYIDDFEATQV